MVNLRRISVLHCIVIFFGVVAYSTSVIADAVDTIPLHKRIDELIETAHSGAVADIASDAEFVRRVYLNLVGRSPTATETRQFLDSDESESRFDRRAKIVDKLIASNEFDDYFVSVLDVLFMERRGGRRIPQTDWISFLQHAVENKWSYDRIVREIIEADGKGQHRGAVKFLVQREVEPNAITRDVGRIFLGRDLQCAQCHDHPNIDAYHQSEYYGILSFVNRSYLFEDDADNKKSYVGEKADGNTEYKSVFAPDEDPTPSKPTLLTGLTLDVEPRFDGDDAYIVAPTKDAAGVPRFSRRAQLARLITHPNNEHFARNAVNRFWAHMMGRGIVDPIDFHHEDNPPSNPQLLETLANAFVNVGFDYRELLREIALSDAYQRSVDFPNNLLAESGEIGSQIAAIENAIERLRSDVESQQPVINRLEADLARRRASVDSIDKTIGGESKTLAESQKKLVETNRLIGNHNKKLSNLKKQQAVLQTAVKAAKAAADAIKNDKQLQDSYSNYKNAS